MENDKENKKKRQKSILMIRQQFIQWMQIKNETSVCAAAMNKGALFVKSTDKHSAESFRVTAFVSEIK